MKRLPAGASQFAASKSPYLEQWPLSPRHILCAVYMPQLVKCGLIDIVVRCRSKSSSIVLLNTCNFCAVMAVVLLTLNLSIMPQASPSHISASDHRKGSVASVEHWMTRFFGSDDCTA